MVAIALHVLLIITSKHAAQRLLAAGAAAMLQVTVQYLPLDNIVCMRRFITHWKPQACILMVRCCPAAGWELCRACAQQLLDRQFMFVLG